MDDWSDGRMSSEVNLKTERRRRRREKDGRRGGEGRWTRERNRTEKDGREQVEQRIGQWKEERENKENNGGKMSRKKCKIKEDTFLFWELSLKMGD